MCHIEPFKGILYNPERKKDISKVVAPPYDMISGKDQEFLYQKDEHNVVRLILGLEYPQDTEETNRYTRAAKSLNGWLKEEILIRDHVPSIYIYEQEYSIKNEDKILSRRGFISLARLEDLGTGRIHPHERTLSAPKEDRLKLMLACKANLSQIFAFYDDPDEVVENALPLALDTDPRFNFVDDYGVKHTLYSLTDTKVIEQIQSLMENKSLFIADGHHRYETALAFRKTMSDMLGGDYPPSYDYCMMYFTNMAAPGLTILPFHRLVSLPEHITIDTVVERMKHIGDLTKLETGHDRMESISRLQKMMSETGKDDHRFGIYAPPDFYLFSYRQDSNKIISAGSMVEELDVSILHRVVLEETLDKAVSLAEIMYLTDMREILQKMDTGEYSMAFLLNPTRIDQVRDIASDGLRMPPKSTNFHPKLISGLVMNVF